MSFIDKEIEKNISFYLELKEPKIEVRCKIPVTEANSNVTIKCSAMKYFNNKIIAIAPEIAYDIDNNEFFYINEAKTTHYCSCQNDEKLKISMAKKN